jgi:4-hydroxy-2-oxoheptanedioate aldolase
MDGGNADGAFTTIPAADYARQINEQRFVMLQIEDPEAMEQLEDIAQIEGVDALMFGPGDFSHALGIAGQLNAPRVEFARRRVADVCNQYQKFAATTGPLERLEELIAMGYQFINLGGDVPILADYFTKTHAAASDIINSAKCGPNDVKGPF